MALFGQGVAEMFKDVVPQTNRFGANAIDWNAVKPFQPIKPMQSWAATKVGSTAPTPQNPLANIPTTQTPQTEYQKWLAAQSGKSQDTSRGYEDRAGTGPYGNGTNLSDKEWSDVKDARTYAQGLAPVDKVGLGALAQFMLSPWGTISKIPELSKQMQEAREETSLFAEMLAADREAKAISDRQYQEQLGSLMQGMTVVGAKTAANSAALDPMQALQAQQQTQLSTLLQQQTDLLNSSNYLQQQIQEIQAKPTVDVDDYEMLQDLYMGLNANQQKLEQLYKTAPTTTTSTTPTVDPTADYLASINAPTTSAQVPTTNEDLAAYMDAITGTTTTTGGLQSAPAETTTTLSPEQTQSMVDSLTAAGYSTGSDGYSSFSPDSPSTGGSDVSMGSAAGNGGSNDAETGGGGGGGGKIICTAMNAAYGFGGYRNAVWLKYAANNLTKAHEVGYHTLFLPLVKYAFNSGDKLPNKVLRAILEHGTRHRTADLRAEMYGRKRDNLGRFYRAIFEPLCYAVGKLKGY